MVKFCCSCRERVFFNFNFSQTYITYYYYRFKISISFSSLILMPIFKPLQQFKNYTNLATRIILEHQIPRPFVLSALSSLSVVFTNLFFLCIRNHFTARVRSCRSRNSYISAMPKQPTQRDSCSFRLHRPAPGP